ncbi:MAG: DSD1 family PLP-dependent enzyme [Lentisphaerae bacterium]|nr:DSD1 family PLP-dependent enzyme [Lentisphaerota bacterium]
MTDSRTTDMLKAQLDTPCLVLEAELLDQNIRAMAQWVASGNKRLRPHAKTHKCSVLARRQMEAGAVGVCAAKLSEAEKLMDAGLRGILVTSPVAAGRIDALAEAAKRDPGIMGVVDCPETVRCLQEAAQRKSVRLKVLVDVDPGMGRTGATVEGGIDLGRFIRGCSALDLVGLQCYAGHLQHLPSYAERCARSRQALQAAARVFRQFQEWGIANPIFTGSGTGTYDADCEIPELTDLQAGSYLFMDAEYRQIGSAEDPLRFRRFRPALTLLATVISANQPGHVTVDAGLKTLFPGRVPPEILVPDHPGLSYEWFGDEHGKIVCAAGAPKPALGSRVELVVSHCDPTVNCFDRYYVIRQGRVVDVWPIDLRGCCW